MVPIAVPSPKVYAIKLADQFCKRDKDGHPIPTHLFKGAQFIKEDGNKSNNLIFSLDGTVNNTTIRELNFEEFSSLLYKGWWHQKSGTEA